MGNSVDNEHRLPTAFIWRRLQSLMGLFIVFFLIEHLFTNSQAALLIGDDGSGFVRSVNFIKNLPYLPVIEILLLGVPFFIHAAWGVHYLLTAKSNSYGNSGKEPYLPRYPRNHAYTWQRLTSWVLLIGIIAHVVQMRFIDYPSSAKRGDVIYYAAPISLDEGIYTVAKRLNVTLYSSQQIQQQRQELLYSDDYGKSDDAGGLQQFLISIQEIFSSSEKKGPLKKSAVEEKLLEQERIQNHAWIEALESKPLKKGEVVAVADNFGTIELMLVRNTFKNPLYIILYTFFVIAACYHGFNGLWTFCITWGITLTKRSQRQMRYLSTFLMALITFLGLAAIWGTFWINLKQ